MKRICIVYFIDIRCCCLVQRVLNTTEPGWVPIDLQRRMSDWFRTTNGAKNLTLMVNAYFMNKNMTHARTPLVTDARKRDDMTEVRIKYIITSVYNYFSIFRSLLTNNRGPLCSDIALCNTCISL